MCVCMGVLVMYMQVNVGYWLCICRLMGEYWLCICRLMGRGYWVCISRLMGGGVLGCVYAS